MLSMMIGTLTEPKAIRVGTAAAPVHCTAEGCGKVPVVSDRSSDPPPRVPTPVVLRDLVALLSAAERARLYEASVTAYVGERAGNLRPCTTPNCGQILPVTQRGVGREWTCGSCAAFLCTGCNGDAHGAVSCDEHAAEVARNANLDNVEVQARRAAAHIDDKLMLPTCPKCQTPFFDFVGCFALHCPECPVGENAFCAICLMYCGSDAHSHVCKCSKYGRTAEDLRTGRVDVFYDKPDGSIWRKIQRERRIDLIHAYLQELDPDVREATINHILEVMAGVNIRDRDLRQGLRRTNFGR
jgi:hypothetical protein